MTKISQKEEPKEKCKHPALFHLESCSEYNKPKDIWQEFDEKFIPESVRLHKDEIDIQTLGIPMIPKELKSFIQQNFISKEMVEKQKLLIVKMYDEEIEKLIKNTRRDKS